MKLAADWYRALEEEIEKPYVAQLKAFLQRERERRVIFPCEEKVFYAFSLTPLQKVKVVIMGQDPYHGEGQAHGLCFSVPEGVEPPPSLKNIFKELKSDLGIEEGGGGCLEGWARQGVLLLNATLTVREGEPKSHFGKGWEQFTDAVIGKLAEREDPVVFVLWGKSAQDKCAQVLGRKKTPHAVLMAPHPSPLSAHAGFFGSRPFSKINSLLEKWNKTPIDFKIN